MVNPLEVHDPQVLTQAKSILNSSESPRDWAKAVVEAVNRNAEWRGRRCINMLAPEAPTSPTVRALLSAEIGTRAAEGHIGRVHESGIGPKPVRRNKLTVAKLGRTWIRNERCGLRRLLPAPGVRAYAVGDGI